jgi:hypothetical protein
MRLSFLLVPLAVCFDVVAARDAEHAHGKFHHGADIVGRQEGSGAPPAYNGNGPSGASPSGYASQGYKAIAYYVKYALKFSTQSLSSLLTGS